jgi:hypothetical protein
MMGSDILRCFALAIIVIFVAGCGQPPTASKEPEIAPCDYARAMSGAFRTAAAVFPAQLPSSATEKEREAAVKREVQASLERIRGLSKLLHVSEKPSGVLTPELRDLAKAYVTLLELKADSAATPEQIENAAKI